MRGVAHAEISCQFFAAFAPSDGRDGESGRARNTIKARAEVKPMSLNGATKGKSNPGGRSADPGGGSDMRRSVPVAVEQGAGTPVLPG